MSAPDVNIERQSKRHYPPLIGMGLILVAVVCFALFSSDLEEVETAPPAAVATE